MYSDFELVLFSTDPQFISDAVSAGVDTIIVDWENAGKERRQAAADTQINYDTVDDLIRVRKSTDARVICRVNNGTTTLTEVKDALAAGVDEILLPMVRSLEKVERVLDLVGGRCGVGILIETEEGVKLAGEFARLPLSRVYMGLNDLAIDRGTPNIFTALIDGTVERVRNEFKFNFGFGGLTVTGGGFPIPCRLLIGELARMKCSFSFLRRSFHRDIQGRQMMVEIPELRRALYEAGCRTAPEIDLDRKALKEKVIAWRNDV